ncbi:MAG: bifunctional glutamate N-acetyltransferase/amino-acid acetyltransferase ArgJ [Gammaproteobacteria bacterium]|nr:bifunctional glutamate N-acetyltransferase/amino-acid acetyltransferase ArgJ [Gammaproteobacteria bacterium]
MAVGLSDSLPVLHPVAGIRLAVASAGIRSGKIGRNDLVLIELAGGAACAAVFTRNAFCAAPVVVARRHLEHSPLYLLINSGNANAGTGAAGLAAAEHSCAAVAKLAGCRAEQVLPFSTGVIGEPLPVERIASALPALNASLAADGWPQAARAIMTTDTVPKAVSRQLEIEGCLVTITGIAKGSGMIHPNMATMLSYVATDAAIDRVLLQQMLQRAVDQSFNCITVDGDTSTNDACVLMATGVSAVRVSKGGHAAAEFQAALDAVMCELAQMVIRDGEGATKFMTIAVTGGRDEAECRRVADTVALSPLVKTAFFASDPNWGRILAAVGRAGVVDMDLQRVVIHLGDVCIVRDGGRAASYTEAQGAAVMKQQEITVSIDLGRGQARAQVWTCDFSYDYVKINAEYRS